MNTARSLLANLLWPPRCPFCGRVGTQTALCSSCAAREQSLRPAPEEVPCPVSLDKLVVCYYNVSVARKGILHMKYSGAWAHALFFGDRLARAVKETGLVFDAVVPVPPDPGTGKGRVQNLPSLLARQVAEQAGAPVLPLLTKQYATPSQHVLPRVRRAGNLTGAFVVENPALAAGKTVLLCDDIVTTGSTLNECAKTLRLFGAAGVMGAAVAYTPAEKK